MPRALDHFAGTHSFTRVAQELGYEVISLDSDPKSKATITADILLQLQFGEPTDDQLDAHTVLLPGGTLC